MLSGLWREDAAAALLRVGGVDKDSFPMNSVGGNGGEVVYIVGYDEGYVQASPPPLTHPTPPRVVKGS